MTRIEEMIGNKSQGPLLGAAAYQNNPVFVEMVGKLGYDIIWFEMEHAHISLAEAAELCRVAAGVGLATMIRIPDNRRDNVLRAAECGPDIINIPMGNTVETLEEFVRHARYSPVGDRGFFGASRAVDYGLITDIVAERERINDRLCLMSQIETREAVDGIAELCAVPGMNAVMLGLGDLSASLGVTGQTLHPTVVQAAEHTIETAKQCGRLVALAGTTEPAKWAAKGVDMLFCTSDIACLRGGAQKAIETVRAAMSA